MCKYAREGSCSVEDVIRKYQPILGTGTLHRHIEIQNKGHIWKGKLSLYDI